MSGHDADEDLELYAAPPTSHKKYAENKDEVRAILFVQWSDDDDKLQKKRSTLQKVLQTLANKFNGNCDVLNVSEDGRTEIRIKPAAAVSELQKMSGRTLKGKDGKTVTIMSVSLTPPELGRQTPDNASEKITSSSVSEPQNVDEQLGVQSSDMTSFTFDVPMLHYWYVNQAYKEEIKHIEKEGGGKIMAEMKLTFEPHQNDGNPNFVFSEFTNLIQKCSAESRGFTFPLKKVNPEGLKDTMKIIQRPENKLWIALSSEDMTVCGPRQSQDAIRKSLDAAQKTLTITNTPAGRFTQTSQKTSLNTAFGSEQPSTSHDKCAENEDEVQVLLSVKWSEDVQPQKCKIELQKLLQTWDNNHDKARNKAREYTVLNVLEDGRAVIRIKPPPAVSELQKLSGQTLKGKDGKTVRITSISLTLPELGIQTPDNASMNRPPPSVSEPQHDQVPPVEQSSSRSSAAASTTEEKTCSCFLPVVHFWYVNHIFKKDIKRIEKEHGVKMHAEVNVTFVGGQKDEGLKEALSEFIELVQKGIGEFEGSVTPLKSLDTEEFKDALKIIQRPEHKLLVALSSEEITIYGPKPIPNAISKSLNAAQTSSANTYNSAAKSQDTSLNKFGVDFKDSSIRQGKVNVTSSKNVTQHQGSTKNSSSVYASQRASSGPVVNSQSGYSTCNTETKEIFAVSERKEMDKMSEEDPEVPMETQASLMSQDTSLNSGRRTDVPSAIHGPFPVQGQHQYGVGKSFYPAQNNFPNPHPSAGQFPQVYQYPTVNMPVQGQHQYGVGKSFYPAQNNFPNPHPSAGQFPQVYQYPSVNMPIRGQQPNAMGNYTDATQDNSTNPHPSAGQFPQVPQDTSNNTEVDQTGQHQDAILKSFDATQNNSTHPDTSAGQVAQVTQDTSLNIGRGMAVGSAQPPTSEAKGKLWEQRNRTTSTRNVPVYADNASMSRPSSVSEPHHLKGQLWEQSNTTTSAHNVPLRQRKADVKAHNKISGGRTSIESRLLQKIVTSPKNVTQQRGATGFSGSTKNSSSVYLSEGASSGPVANSQSGYSTRNTDDSARKGATAGDNEDEDLCAICQDTLKNKKQLKCKHEFCEECLEESKKYMGPICPVCEDVFGVIEGTQPEGTMSVHKSSSSLPGFKGCDTIVIDYYFPSGKQMERHPNPGQRYDGTSRTAYLPDNKEGKEVLHLLEKAFAQKLIFTVGMSTTTGRDNQVTWNNIHHKTSKFGGPQSFGYPDPDYLRRVRDELKAKGIE